MKQMKRIKKITSVLLALVMLFSMSALAFADGTGTSTDPYLGSGDLGDDDLDGSINIFKYDVSAWEKEINENRPVGAEADYEITYNPNKATGKELTATDVVGYYYLTSADESAETNKQNVLLGDLDKLSNITFRIQSAIPVAGKEGSTSVNDYTVTGAVNSYGKTVNGVMSWTGVARGYYIVTELDNETTSGVITPFVISVPMVDPADIENPVEVKDIYVYPKNRLKDGPEVVKEITSNLDNGNTVSWRVVADVPSDIGTSLRYVVTDTMSAGLEYVAGSVVVKSEFGGSERTLVLGTDYTAVATPNAATGETELKITLTEKGRENLGLENSERLVITYNSIVNLSEEEWKALVEKAVNNEVILEFTNSDNTDYKSDPGTVTIDEFAGLEIEKKDGATGENLKGVKFKLYTALNVAGDDIDAASVLKDAAGNEIELITDEDGIASYYGLLKGTYYLKEISTLDGYKLLTGYKTVTVTAANAKDNDVIELEILNYLDNTITLPQTGGMGTFLFTLIGIVLLATAGFVFVVAKKRKVAR